MEFECIHWNTMFDNNENIAMLQLGNFEKVTRKYSEGILPV